MSITSSPNKSKIISKIDIKSLTDHISIQTKPEFKLENKQNKEKNFYSKDSIIHQLDFLGKDDTVIIKKIQKQRNLSEIPRGNRNKNYNNGLLYLQKKEKKINKLNILLSREKYAEIKNKPEINKKSKQIINQKFVDQIPIYLRTEELIDDKINKINKIRNYNNNENLKKEMNEISGINKNPHIEENSIKNTNTNFNNKFLNLNTQTFSGNNDLLKIINEANNDIKNLQVINENQNNSQGKNYLEILEKKFNSRKDSTKNKQTSPEDKNEKFKVNANCQQRTLDWIEKKERWARKKSAKIRVKRGIALEEEFHYHKEPKENINSQKIIYRKKVYSHNDQYLDNNENNDLEILIEDNNFDINTNLFRTEIKSPSPKRNSKSVHDSLYERRISHSRKREKILKETMLDFTPRINEYKKPRTSFIEKTNKIPIPKNRKLNKNLNENNYNFVETDSNKDLYKDKKNNKKREKSLAEKLNDVEIENKKIEKNNSKTENDTYKLNIRSSSAWDMNKENNAYSDDKFAKMLSKIGSIKF